MFRKIRDEIESLKAEVSSYCGLLGDRHDDVAKLREGFNTLKTTVSVVTTEMGDLKIKHWNDLERIKIDFERKLVEFHKEISDKYFQSLESIFKYTREIQLIDNLSKNTNDSDFKALRSALMQPLLDYRYNMEREQTGAKIDKLVDTKRTDIVAQRDKLHDEFIIIQREGRDTKLLEGKLSILNSIIEEAQKNETTR